MLPALPYSDEPGCATEFSPFCYTALKAPEEIPVLWLTAGLGCDGETIAMTAATQPSIEDLARAPFPGPRGSGCTTPSSRREVGDEFLRYFHQARSGELGPFILVVEGSIPDETNKAEGYWASFGTDPDTGQPITTCSWIDRLAPTRVGGDGGRDLRGVRRHPRDGRETRRAAWACPTTWVGLEVTRRASRSCASRAARRSRTT